VRFPKWYLPAAGLYFLLDHLIPDQFHELGFVVIADKYFSLHTLHPHQVAFNACYACNGYDE
jgi:hypothetical protein